MDAEKKIRGKRVLIVDDEVDVLDTLTDALDMCKIDRASSFEEGKRLLETNEYHVAILDIMGVRGYELLDVANEVGTPALMLTAHALSVENLKKSAAQGAAYYAPKEEMDRIAEFVADVIEAVEKNKNPWTRWFDRLADYYDSRFGGTDWREKEKEFWENRIKSST